MLRHADISSNIAVGAALISLSACATPRMHTQDELNSATRQCGLALGQLIQDEEAKQMLIVMRIAPSASTRSCVYQWARKRHLKLVVIDAIEFPEE